MKDKKKRNDIILIAVCLFAAAIAFFAVRLLPDAGAAVVVSVDGDEWGRYPLEDNITVTVSSKNGSNTLIIRDRKAYVTDATCPDGLCEKMHSISRRGESIVCLPNKVVITVTGGDGGVDLMG